MNVMMKNAFKHAMNCFKKGDLVGGTVGLSIAVIVVIGVGIPITQSMIASGNLTGITATIVGFVPTFLALTLLIASVSLMRGGN